MVGMSTFCLRELGEVAQPDVSVRHAVIAQADAADGHNFERLSGAAGCHDGNFDANSRQRAGVLSEIVGEPERAGGLLCGTKFLPMDGERQAEFLLARIGNVVVLARKGLSQDYGIAAGNRVDWMHFGIIQQKR
jgi:hypothetical protein